MIGGAHVILYSRDAEADRSFLRDVLGCRHVDAGGGWLIFALPPTEVAVHPAADPTVELYLMCDDLAATMAELTAKGVAFDGTPTEQGWGTLTTIRLPGGGSVGLYEPHHPLAIELDHT